LRTRPASSIDWIPSRTYPDLRANISGEAYAFTDHPFQVSDDYPSAPQIRAYLDSYADRFGLRQLIRLATEVTEVRHGRSQSGKLSGWEVTGRPADDLGPPQTQKPNKACHFEPSTALLLKILNAGISGI
jgi:hypothetical protein